MSQWWNQNQKIPYEDRNFLKILDFYLFNCPIMIKKSESKIATKYAVSHRAITLEKKGWSAHKLTLLLKTMSTYVKPEFVETDESVISTCNNNEQNSTNDDPHFEMIVCYETIGKTRSIFYAIRNAFAHGSFSVVNTNHGSVYYFQSQKETKLRARIRLKEQTLLDWINIFNNGPKELEKTKQNTSRIKKARRSV